MASNKLNLPFTGTQLSKKINSNVIISNVEDFIGLGADVKQVTWDDPLRGGNFTFSETTPTKNDGIIWFSGYRRNTYPKELTLEQAGLQFDGSQSDIDKLQKLRLIYPENKYFTQFQLHRENNIDVGDIYVDPIYGDDLSVGSATNPIKTMNCAISKLSNIQNTNVTIVIRSGIIILKDKEIVNVSSNIIIKPNTGENVYVLPEFTILNINSGINDFNSIKQNNPYNQNLIYIYNDNGKQVDVASNMSSDGIFPRGGRGTSLVSDNNDGTWTYNFDINETTNLEDSYIQLLHWFSTSFSKIDSSSGNTITFKINSRPSSYTNGWENRSGSADTKGTPYIIYNIKEKLNGYNFYTDQTNIYLPSDNGEYFLIPKLSRDTHLEIAKTEINKLNFLYFGINLQDISGSYSGIDNKYSIINLKNTNLIKNTTFENCWYPLYISDPDNTVIFNKFSNIYYLIIYGRVNNPIFNDNIVTNSGTFWLSRAAIGISGNNIKINNNKLYHCNAGAISSSYSYAEYGTETFYGTIDNNIVVDTGSFSNRKLEPLWANDTGPIQSSGRGNAVAYTITRNTVINLDGNFWLNIIFLDDGTHGITVKDNILIGGNCKRAIGCRNVDNKTHDNVITGNIVFGDIWVIDRDNDKTSIVNNNILVTGELITDVGECKYNKYIENNEMFYSPDLKAIVMDKKWLPTNFIPNEHTLFNV